MSREFVEASDRRIQLLTVVLRLDKSKNVDSKTVVKEKLTITKRKLPGASQRIGSCPPGAACSRAVRHQ